MGRISFAALAGSSGRAWAAAGGVLGVGAARPTRSWASASRTPRSSATRAGRRSARRDVRYVVAWDALRFHVEQRDEVDAYMTAARAPGARRAARLRPLAQSRSAGRAAPCPRRGFRKEFLKFRDALPVGARLPDLERGQPLRRADLPQGPASPPATTTTPRTTAAAARSSAADVLDTPTMPRLGARQFRRTARARTSIDLGRCTTTSTRTASARAGTRALLQGAPHGQIWFTETGGLVVRRNGSRIEFPGNKKHAARATKQVFQRSPRLSPRVRRIYFYHWSRRRAGCRRGTRRWSTRAASRARPTRAQVLHRKFARAAARQRAARGAPRPRGEAARSRRGRALAAGGGARGCGRRGRSRRGGTRRRRHADRLLAAARARARAPRRDIVDGEKLALAQARRDGRALTRSTSSRSTRAPGAARRRARVGRARCATRSPTRR